MRAGTRKRWKRKLRDSIHSESETRPGRRGSQRSFFRVDPETRHSERALRPADARQFVKFAVSRLVRRRLRLRLRSRERRRRRRRARDSRCACCTGRAARDRSRSTGGKVMLLLLVKLVLRWTRWVNHPLLLREWRRHRQRSGPPDERIVPARVRFCSSVRHREVLIRGLA